MRRLSILTLLFLFILNIGQAQNTSTQSVPAKKHGFIKFLGKVAKVVVNNAINTAASSSSSTSNDNTAPISPRTGNYGNTNTPNINPTNNNYGSSNTPKINPTNNNYTNTNSQNINPTNNNWTNANQTNNSNSNWTTPVQQMSKPVELSKPVDNFTTPQQLSKPVELSKPVQLSHPVELSKPVDNFTTPQQLSRSVEMSKPVENWTTPVQQLSKPVELSKPVQLSRSVKLSKPVENWTTPLQQMSNPVNNTFTTIQLSTPIINGFSANPNAFSALLQISTPINQSTSSLNNSFTIANSNTQVYNNSNGSDVKSNNTTDNPKQSFDIRTFIPLGWVSQGMDATFYANELIRQSNIARAQGNYQVATDLANQAIAISSKGIKTVKTGVANDLLMLATGETINVAKGGKVVLGVGLTEFTKIGSTGIIGQEYLAKLGGVPQKYFPTIIGDGGRYIDQFVNGVAYESKVGYTALTQDIKMQIAKDAELLSTNPEFKKVVWCFFKSPVTGEIGASQPLLNALKSAGIETRIIELAK